MTLKHYRELEVWQLILSERVGLLSQGDLGNLLQVTDRVSRMMSGLRRSLQKRL